MVLAVPLFSETFQKRFRNFELPFLKLLYVLLQHLAIECLGSFYSTSILPIHLRHAFRRNSCCRFDLSLWLSFIVWFQPFAEGPFRNAKRFISSQSQHLESKCPKGSDLRSKCDDTPCKCENLNTKKDWSYCWLCLRGPKTVGKAREKWFKSSMIRILAIVIQKCTSKTRHSAYREVAVRGFSFKINTIDSFVKVHFSCITCDCRTRISSEKSQKLFEEWKFSPRDSV